jgi:hypothetical protein
MAEMGVHDALKRPFTMARNERSRCSETCNVVEPILEKPVLALHVGRRFIEAGFLGESDDFVEVALVLNDEHVRRAPERRRRPSTRRREVEELGDGKAPSASVRGACTKVGT